MSRTKLAPPPRAAALDPAWEYYVPDPEVEAAVYGRPGRGWDVLFDPESFKGGNWGFRLGKGHPDRGACFRPARERRRRPPPEGPEPKRCRQCERLFVPARKCRVYCSRACRGGAPKVLPRSASCKGCGATFAPHWSGHEFCSRACASRAAAPGKRRDPPAEFAAMYAAGASMKEMEARFGVRKCQLRRWRRRLGLPARAPGRPAGKRPLQRGPPGLRRVRAVPGLCRACRGTLVWIGPPPPDGP